MTVGVVMMAHAHLGRAEQVARHWVAGGCPVVVHIDKKVPQADFAAFEKSVADAPMIKLSKRHACEWGMWGLVAATQDASAQMLSEFKNVRHVFLTSGSCLPLRPVQELVGYLDAHPDTDFIESATTAEVSWAVDGLEEERFSFRFPFSWRKQRRLFDLAVRVQRSIGLHRTVPAGLKPHIGSQWWCLTRDTLTDILENPLRDQFDRYFKGTWIPDESYFQTLARISSRRLESRSLTLSKFDIQGKPHIFYDDHLQLLRRSDCFVARKIWPQADRLYDAFLRSPDSALKQAEPQPGKIDRLFSRATERRTRGRPGLSMQSRFPNESWENGLTAQPYTVLEGFDDVFEDFQPWLKRQVEATVHGHIFAKDRVKFADGAPIFRGAMSDSAILRDYNPYAFLKNLIWNTRGQHQCFMMGPRDNMKIVQWEIVKDPNASVFVISGAWLIGHFKSNLDLDEVRADAALCQKMESRHLKSLLSRHVKAKNTIWTLAEFLENPVENLRLVLDSLSPGLGQGLTDTPRLTDLSGFSEFIRTLKNEGMHPYLLDDYDGGQEHPAGPTEVRKPYLVR